VYRDAEGDLIRLRREGVRFGAEYWDIEDGYWRRHGGSFDLDTGECARHSYCNLIPGELHLFNGEWCQVVEKVTEQARSPYFAEAVESNWLDLSKPDWHPANAAMLARDAANYVPRPAAPVVIQEPAKTSHGPIAGLTVVAAVDHRLGSAFR
jgi:hypothetical protein